MPPDFAKVLDDPRPKRIVVYVEFDLPDGQVEVTITKSGAGFSDEAGRGVHSTMARMVAVVVDAMEALEVADAQPTNGVQV